MLDQVIIQSSNSSAKPIFTQAKRHYDKRLDSFTAILESDGLSAASEVDGFIFDPVIMLFNEVAKQWRGWDGEKTACSCDDKLHFSCTSDGLGHTFLRTKLVSGINDEDWEVQATLRLDTIQLEQIPNQLKQFLDL
jgi:hypothetical protein